MHGAAPTFSTPQKTWMPSNPDAITGHRPIGCILSPYRPTGSERPGLNFSWLLAYIKAGTRGRRQFLASVSQERDP